MIFRLVGLFHFSFEIGLPARFARLARMAAIVVA